MPRQITIGLVHNWPGRKNSELEIILRIRNLLTDEHNVLVLDPLGFVLDDHAKRTGTAPIADGTCHLILNFHYLNPKFFSGLSFVVNWNPLDFLICDPASGAPVPVTHLHYLCNCFRSHDRVLSAGSVLVDQFIETVRRDRGGTDLPGASLELHTTIASSGHGDFESKITANSFRVFYIGLNWEKTSIAGGKPRHDSLLRRLDESGRFSFYGLREQGGIFLWDGINCYEGELPFDGGASIIEESRKCGVSLILSTSQHRASGLVSTRVFQACAAGTVIISDDNSFIKTHFGDSILYFEYGQSEKDTAENILEKVRWVEENWSEARRKAMEAQEIFKERFDLEKQLKAISMQALRDLEYLKSEVQRLSGKSIAVHYLSFGDRGQDLSALVQNVSGQSHLNVKVYVYHSSGSIDLPEGLKNEAEIIEFSGGDVPTRIGTTLVKAGHLKEDYHLWYSDGFEWRRDHLLNLLASCERSGASIAHSPYFASHVSLAEDTDDMMRYFFYGLNGSPSRLTEESIKSLDLTDLPMGNVLIEAGALRSALDSITEISFFDHLAPALLIRQIYENHGATTIAFSPVISSLHIDTEGVAHITPYIEAYSDANDVGWQRDQNLYAAFYGRQRLDTGSYADRRLLMDTVSRNFSWSIYLNHVLRNRPLLLGFIRRLHKFGMRVLRLNKI